MTLLLLVTTTTTWAQWWSPQWDKLLENLIGYEYENVHHNDMSWTDCYNYHRPTGCIESVDVCHGSISVSGWVLDLDDEHETSVTIILRQGDGDKYNFTTRTTFYRSNIEGNAYFHGHYGFQATWPVTPGTYELYAFANNRQARNGLAEPISRLPIGFKEEGYHGLEADWNASRGNVTYYHKTITVLPYQYHVTFDINYEGGVNPNPIDVPDNTIVWLPFPPESRPHHTFVCWSKSNVQNESAHVYANWIKGKGTDDDPFLVEDLDDWNMLSLMCSQISGTNHAWLGNNSAVKLKTDLTVTQRLDRVSGEFDGGGHTITYNCDISYKSSLFGSLSDVWLHDLKVQGTFSSSKSAGTYSGLAYEYGAIDGFRNTKQSTIENVEVSVDFDTNYTYEGTTAGYGVSGFIGRAVGRNRRSVLLKNCVYNGRMPRKGKVSGGFIADVIAEKANIEFQNCVFAPKEMVVKPAYTFASLYSESNGIYYTESGENVQGEQVFTELPATGAYIPVTVMDKEYFLTQNSVSITSDNTYYAYTGAPITNITFSVSRDGTPLSADAYTSVFRNEAGNTMAWPKDIGAYRHEVTIDDKTYIRSIYVTGPLTQTDGAYQINNVADWMTFAADVAAGTTYSGSTVRLNADITTSAMVGTESYKFSGIFDGGGHTLTFNYQSVLRVYDPTEDLRAPFRYIDGATIRNLTVAGTTVSAGRQMGGLVAYAAGNNSITDCTVAASLNSCLNNDTSNGGFIAHVEDGSTAFSGCVFNGYLLGSNAESSGGFVGWSGGTLSFDDCLFNPIYVNMKDEGSCTFARGSGGSFTNTYYTTALGELQGTQTYSTPQSSLCNKHTMDNGSAIYMVHSSAIEGLADTYAYNDGNDVDLGSYRIKYNGATLSADKYTVTIRNSAGEEVSAPTAVGHYTLTATGNATDNDAEGYCGAVSQDFWVMKTLTTDANGFYQIADEDDWCSLDYYIQNTTNCKAKLTADIGTAEAPVTTMLTVEDHHFNGVIDGDGHTLTVNLTGTGMAAPFLYAGNATFVNLNVAGTIRATNEGAFSGGIVALLLGNQNFVSCRSSVNIDCPNNACAGGFVGYAATGSGHDITFRDCLFDGVISGQIKYSAGFVGYHHTEWPTTTLTLTNCLTNGTINTSLDTYSIVSPFYSYPDITNQEYYVTENSYYKFESAPLCSMFHDDQGSSTALAGTELQTLLGDGWTVDGNDEVVPKSDALYTMNITVAGDIAHGAVECQATGVPGNPVNLTIIPEGGYLPASVSYNDGTDHIITPQDGSYSFIMPDADVTVSATFSLSPTAISYVAYNTATGMYDSRLTAAAIDVTSDAEVMGISGKETWYVVSSDVTNNNRITVNGTVNLILADDATLTAVAGITVHEGNTLNIYGQTEGTGAIVATAVDAGGNYAAIGTEHNVTAGENPEEQVSDPKVLGTISIHGGHITATGGAWSAGIGGGVGGGGGTINIYGGHISSTATNPGLGIQQAIGCGSSGEAVTRSIVDGLCVYRNNNSTPDGYNNRIGGLDQKVVSVEPCTEHNYAGNVCTYCGHYHHYELSYNANGATGGDAPSTATISSDGDRMATVSDNTGELERVGYTFAGWNTAADGSGTAYEPGDEFTISEMVTLYAQWEVITYLIDCDLSGGTLPEGQSNPVEYNIESENITLVNPALDGRFFMGWSGTGIDDTAKNVTIAHGSTGDRYYTAMWDDDEPPFEGMEIDHDYSVGQLGRFFVKMPYPGEEDYDYDEDDNEICIISGVEETPRIVNIPEGFTTAFKVYDDGGKDRFYNWNPSESHLITLILNAPEGKVFSVSGIIEIEEFYGNHLKIYDGTTTDNEIEVQYALDEWGYETYTAIPFVTTSNSIRFDLYAEDDMTQSGMDLTVAITDAPVDITLLGDDSQSEQTNNSLIASNNGLFANVTLDDRTLYKDGHWNTICLPFDIDDISVTPLNGATLKALSSASFDDETSRMTISSTDASSIEAGKPYLVKWEIAHTVTDGSGYYDMDKALVDGHKEWTWLSGVDNGFCEFHTSGTRQVTGYTLTTCDGVVYHNDYYNKDYIYNPKAWVLYGKLNESDEWTVIDSRDATTTPADALPTTDMTDKYYTAANPGTYRYFRYEVTIGTEEQYNYARLGELTLHGDYTTGSEDLIENPTFNHITIKNELHPMISSEVFFAGHFGTMGHIDGVILDEHDSDGDAMHAILSVFEPTAPTGYSFEGWCTDAGLTTPATTIPFDATTGDVTLYANITENVLELANAADNSDDIQKAATNGGEYKATLAGRKLYKDGDWNTLCLPFNLGNPEAEEGHYFDGTPLEGATVKTLTASSFADGTLTLTFSDDLDAIQAGKPYLVKWAAQEPDYVENPVFTGVTISNAPANVTTEYVNFVGTYSPIIYNEVNRSVLFMGGGSSLYYPDGTKSTTINACRAYFTLNGITAGDPANGGNVKGFVLNFDGEDDPDGLNEELRMKNEEFATAKGWYSLDGKKLDGKPTQRGIYIHNGKKVLY